MKISDKIQILKSKIGFDNDPLIRDTIQDPYDFKRAIESAIKFVALDVKIFEKNILIPIVNEVYSGNLNLTDLTKDSVDFVRPINIIVNEQPVFINDLPLDENSDSMFALIRNLFQNLALIHNINTDVKAGKIGSITSITNNLITSSVSGTLDDFEIITNLDKADYLVVDQRKIVSWSTNVVEVEESASNTNSILFVKNWEVGDKIYLSKVPTNFLRILFQASPNMFYLDNRTDINIAGSIIDIIDDICLHYLYCLLPESYLNRFATQLNMGIFMTKENCKRRIRTVINKKDGPAVVKAYNPVQPRYGR